MALWEGFLECWKDFADRMDNDVCLLNYLKTNEECIRPETTKHLLSIGPGTGEKDHGLVSLLPHLTSYTAVEPDSGALDTTKRRLEEFTAIEKHFVHGVMETYTGPPCGADIILMSHVGYYFADFTHQIGRALSWLKTGGRILLVQEKTNSITTLICSALDVHLDTGYEVRGYLEDMGADFTESAIDYTLDVSYPGPSYYGFVSMIVDRQITKQEVDKAVAALRPHFIPGTEKMHCAQSLFVIQNKPCTLEAFDAQNPV